MSTPQLADGVGAGSAADDPDGGRRRKRLGQWFTPPALVDHLVAVVHGLEQADPASSPVRTVLDPACGDGRFLVAAREAFGPQVQAVGIDLDERAVAAARTALPGAEIHHADALAMEFGDRRFDLVIGNPPFLNQLAASTTRGGRSRFGGGPYADAAAEFLALATRLTRADGGRVALVLPQSILTTRDAGPIRAEILTRASLTHAWWSTTSMFDAHVHVCALVLTAGSPVGPVRRSCGPTFEPREPVTINGSWGRLLVEHPEAVASIDGNGNGNATIGERATFTVDFRDQYYGLVGAVADDADGPPLVTSGLIDPGVCHWGRRPVRFAKQRFVAPRVDLSVLEPKLQRWAAQRLVPKVLIANQTRLIEAVIDPAGAWLPSVPVITCVPNDVADLEAVAAALSSPSATAWVLERAAGSGLSPGAVRLTPSLLAAIPWPTDAR